MGSIGSLRQATRAQSFAHSRRQDRRAVHGCELSAKAETGCSAITRSAATRAASRLPSRASIAARIMCETLCAGLACTAL